MFYFTYDIIFINKVTLFFFTLKTMKIKYKILPSVFENLNKYLFLQNQRDKVPENLKRILCQNTENF